jgi:predicted SnoaL-like aldol condensation-catalyzing enzyme
VTTNDQYVQMLHAIYKDLASIGRYAADDIVVYRADSTPENTNVVQGKEAVIAHEKAFAALGEGTLVADVGAVIANDYFGAVLGVMKVTLPKPASMPFCGLWKFRDHKIVAHWENGYDLAAFEHLIGEYSEVRA